MTEHETVTKADVDSKVTTHKGDASAHHTKTTDASELTSGALNSKDRLPNLSTGKIWQGNANRPAEVDPPSVPSGLIVMWHGTIATIPAGWVICDGNNSTPNLLTRFVEGVATATTNPGATGGATSKSHNSHRHTMPTHTHTLTKSTSQGTGYSVDSAAYKPGTGAKDPGDTNSTTVSAHSDIRPLFMDLAFLMKT